MSPLQFVRPFWLRAEREDISKSWAIELKILNRAISDDLNAGKPLRLDIGCGPSPTPGFYGVDIADLPGVDIAADLNLGLPDLPDNSVREIVTNHCLEHVSEFMDLMRDLHRVTAPGGRITVTVPHYSNPFGYSDPTHVRFFGLYSMYYFVPVEFQKLKRKVPSFYVDFKFDVASVEIQFYRDTIVDKLLAPMLERFLNRSPERLHFYERRIAPFFHARQITWVLHPLQ